MTIRNVLLIGVDQMRSDVLGPDKQVPAHTPHLDELMAQSVAFDRAYSTCPLCSPARASMFTGDYAFRHGMGTNCDMYHSLSRELQHPERLLHRHLLDAGYRCGFVGKWHVGAETGPADFGFEGMSLPGYGNIKESDQYRSYLRDNNLSYSVEPTLFFNPDEQTLAAGRWKGPVASTPSHFLTNRTIDLLKELAAGDAPFFATVQYWDPHQPHLVPDEYYGFTDRSQLKAWPNFADDLSGKPRRVSRERDDFYRCHPRTEDEVIEYIGLYCDHMAMLDAEIGRLLEWVQSSGLGEDTLVIFTSDHGDMTGSHGGLIDKGLLYEEAVRIPLTFSHPEITPGRRDALVTNMDIMPTAIELLGLTHEKRHGDSLVPLIFDADAATRDALLVEYHGLRFLYSQRAVIARDGWKFIFSPGDDDELYDLTNDPEELHNRVGDPAVRDELGRLKRLMMQETARYDDPLRDCVAKFNGQWRTGSGQFDVSSVHLDRQGN